jgi:hypothetical protein
VRPCCMKQPTGAVSLQYGGGGTHGSNWQQAADGAQPLVQTPAAREPAGHGPLSGAGKQGGGAPPQQGTTQYRPGPQVEEPHATSLSSPPAPESLMPSLPPAADPPAPAAPDPAFDPAAPDEESALPAIEPPEPALEPPCPVGSPSPALPHAAAVDTTASSATTLREACITADGCNSRASRRPLRISRTWRTVTDSSASASSGWHKVLAHFVLPQSAKLATTCCL